MPRDNAFHLRSASLNACQDGRAFFLQELIYFKDAERLLLRARDARIEERDEKYFLKAEAAGEPLDAARHHQRADVKAVTLHGFSVEKDDGGWKARVLLDI